MASKLQIVTEFSQKKTLEVASVRGNWQRYLKTAARIYKYPFRDQLLIHAQRPDATACATIEFWNSRMDRWVNRGSRGIALLDDSGHKTRLKYVFDVSDTHPGRHRPQAALADGTRLRGGSAGIHQQQLRGGARTRRLLRGTDLFHEPGDCGGQSDRLPGRTAQH